MNEGGRVARWGVSPRGGGLWLDERAALAAPWLLVAAHALTRRMRPGARLRRFVLTRLARFGMALVDREEWANLARALDPAVEIFYYPDAPARRPADIAASYTGPAAYIEILAGTRAAFGASRIEVVELIDPGGDRVALHTEFVATGALSGAETAMTQFHVWEFRRGRLRRQWVLDTEAATVATALHGQDPWRRPDS